jgi:hypothetical protein
MVQSKNLSDLDFIAEDLLSWLKTGKHALGFITNLENERWDVSYYEPIDFEVGKIDFPYKIVQLGEVAKISLGRNIKNAKIAINKTGSKVIWMAEGYGLIEKNNIFIVPNKNINPYYLYLYLCSAIGHKTLEKIIKGAYIPYISQKDLQKLSVVVPNLEKQYMIVQDAFEIKKTLAALESLVNEGNSTIRGNLFKLREIKDKFESFSQATQKAFYQTLPFPIAVIYRKMSNAPNNTQRFSLMIELFEAVVKFIVLVNFSDYINKQRQEEKIIQEIPNIGKLCMPSLGDWIQFFNALLRIKSLPHSQPFIVELRELKVEKYSRVFDEFVKMRNESLKGHGSTISEEEYAIKFQEYFPKLEDLIKNLSFLTNYLLMQGLSMTKDGDIFKVNIKKLTGDNILFPTEILEVRNPIDTDKAIYLNKNGECLILEPFIILAQCPECRRDELLLLDKFNDTKITYLSYECGHRPSFPNVDKLPMVIRELAVKKH